jgi:hypothetical protein
MNKLHGSKEKRKHYSRQGGPKTSPNTALRLTPFAQILRQFAKPENVRRHYLKESDGMKLKKTSLNYGLKHFNLNRACVTG